MMTSTVTEPLRAEHRGARPLPDRTPLAPLVILGTLALITLVLALAVASPSAGGAGIATELRATADTVDGHATTMTVDADRLAEHALAVPAADRALWLAQAQHMTSDASSLRALAQRLRTAAAVLGDHPTYSANASSVALAATASQLRADGEAAVAHGRAMTQMAAYLVTLAGRTGSGITPADASVIEADASRIIDAGERTMQAASRVDAGADQLRRAFGR